MKKIIIIIFACIIVILGFVVFKKTNITNPTLPIEKNESTENNSSKKKDSSFNIDITGQKNAKINSDILKEVETKEIEATAIAKITDEKKSTNKYDVFNVKDLLKSKGINKYTKITVIGKDGYSATFDNKTELYIAYKMDGEEIKDLGPLRLIVPEEKADKWVINIKEIKVQ